MGSHHVIDNSVHSLIAAIACASWRIYIGLQNISSYQIIPKNLTVSKVKKCSFNVRFFQNGEAILKFILHFFASTNLGRNKGGGLTKSPYIMLFENAQLLILLIIPKNYNSYFVIFTRKSKKVWKSVCKSQNVCPRANKKI